MAGRRPKPTELKRTQGNPGKRKLNRHEPQPTKGRPTMPSGLGHMARDEWNRILVDLESLGVITTIDGSALAAYCQAFERWMIAEREIADNGITFITKFLDKEGNLVEGDIKKNPAVTVADAAMKIMKSFLIEFGMTPASRAKLNVSQPEEKDPLEKFLEGGSSNQKRVN